MDYFYFIKVDGWEAVQCSNADQAEEFAAALTAGMCANSKVVRSDGRLEHEFFAQHTARI